MPDIKEVTEKAHFTALLIGNSLGWIVSTIIDFIFATLGVVIMYSPVTLLMILGLHYNPSIVGAVLTGVLVVNYTYYLHHKERLRELTRQINRRIFLLVYSSYNLMILVYASISNYLYTITNAAFILALFWFAMDAWLIEHNHDNISIAGIIMTAISKLTKVDLKSYSLFGGTGFTGFFGKLQNVFQ